MKKFLSSFIFVCGCVHVRDFILDLIIYWILYWIIGGFYQKCVYFVRIGSKTRTGLSLDFVLDNWWIFVKHLDFMLNSLDFLT